MSDLLRESTVGALLNRVSRGRILPFPDQRPDFVIPPRYLASASPAAASTSPGASRPPSVAIARTPVEGSFSEEKKPKTLPHESNSVTQTSPGAEKNDRSRSEATLEAGPDESPVSETEQVDTKGYTVVDWYGDDDPENPRNWSFPKRAVVMAEISLLSISVYIGPAIYTSSIPYVEKAFGVSDVVATLGLSLFIEAYGIGPMFLSPLQELPSVGRLPVYIITIILFAVLQIPTALSKNIGSLLALRFITGFLSSPALATGGASIGDIFPPETVPYAIGLWAMGGVAGPVLGPVVGSFAAAANGWRWPLWELAWLSGFTAIILVFLFPETLPDTILLRRAQRLRKLTGNQNLRSRSEIKQSELSASSVAREYLIRPFQLLLEPAVMFINLYTALAYAVFYLWFEAFPLVFEDIYGFKGGVAGLPFLGIIVGVAVTFVSYCFYLKYYLFPRFARLSSPQPEEHLHLALVAGLFIPASLLIFGWTARSDVHWIFPIIGAGMYIPGICLLFQSALVYLPASYPHYVASILAGNALSRGSVAAAFPLFGRAYYDAVGIGGGCSILAGVAFLMLPFLWALMKWGGKLRERSKFAQ